MSQTMIVMGAALGAELVLLLLVALSVAWLRNRAARRRDHAAIQALVARVRRERPQREQAIGRFLGAGLGYQDGVLGETTTRLARAELQLLQRFAMLYRERDADLAGRFDGELNAMLDAYHALAASTSAAPADDTAQPAADDAELEALRRENTRLSEELRITMETMSRMLNEYSTMFAPTAEPEGLESAPAALDAATGAEQAVSDLAVEGEDGWAAVAAAADERAAADDGDWEVAVDAVGSGEVAGEGDWEVAVDAPAQAEQPSPGDRAGIGDPEPGPEPEPEDPLAEIMRAAANQEKSARGVVEGRAGLETDAAAQAETAGRGPGAVEDDADLFDVVVEGTTTTAKADPGRAAGLPEEPGDDLFDLVEAPRSRSAS